MDVRRLFWRLAPYGLAIIFIPMGIYGGEPILGALVASMLISSGAAQAPTIARARELAAAMRRTPVRVAAVLNLLLVRQVRLGATASIACGLLSLHLTLLAIRGRALVGRAG